MEREKYVDESWKESAQQEKEKLKTVVGSRDQSSKSTAATDLQSSTKEDLPHTPEPSQNQSHGDPEESSESQESQISFLNYLSSLAYQAMIFLGEIPNPMTNMPEANLEQAKFIIETLVMLREKTKGNLTKKESDILNTSLYQLQMKYVELYQKEGGVV